MPIDIRCPACRDSFPVTEAPGKQALDCPNCGKRFVATAEHGAPPVGGAKCPGCGTPSGITAGDRPVRVNCTGCKQTFTLPAANAAPAAAKSSSTATKSTKPGAKKPARNRDDDDDDRPKKLHGSGGSGVGVIVIGVLGLLFLVAGFGLAGYLIFSPKKEAETVTTPATKTTPADRGVPDPFAPGPVGPVGPRPVDPWPDDPRPKPKPVPKIPQAAPVPAITFPEPAGEIRVGGGGKYLFIHFPASRQLGVFEPSVQKITRYITLADEEAIFTAGLNHLVVAYPKQNILTRFSLATFAPDMTVKVEGETPIYGLGMGSASNGPLLVGAGTFARTKQELYLINVLNMRRVVGTEIKEPGVFPEPGMRFWATNDGRIFTATAGGLTQPTVFHPRPSGWVFHHIRDINPPLIGADGDAIYGSGRLASLDGKEIGTNQAGPGRPAVLYAPAIHGPFFVSLNLRKEGEWSNERWYLATELHAGRDQRPLLALPELPETGSLLEWARNPSRKNYVDQFVFYVPYANLLAIVSGNRDRISLRPLDLKAELTKAPGDHLIVVSRPPLAVKGQAFKYVPEFWSKSGKTTLRLNSGPGGMKVDGSALVWDVPATFPGTSADVILTVGDGSREVFHNFELAVLPAPK